MTNETALLGLLAEKQQEIYQLRAVLARAQQSLAAAARIEANLHGEIAELTAEIRMHDTEWR